MHKKILMLLLLGLMIVPMQVKADDSQETDVVYTVDARIVFKINGREIIQFVKTGDKLNEPSHDEINGYIFKGWYFEDTKWNFDDPVNEHMTLVAVYDKVYVPEEKKNESSVKPSDKKEDKKEETKPEVKTGKIVNVTSSNRNYLHTTFVFKQLDLPLSKEDIERISQGDNYQVRIVSDNSTKSIEQQTKSLFQKHAYEKEFEIGTYVNIKFQHKFEKDSEWLDYEKTNGLVEISIELPDNLKENNRVFAIYTIKDEEVKELYKGYPNSAGTITFEADNPGDFVIAYKDTLIVPPVSEETSHNILPWIITGLLLMLLGLSGWFIFIILFPTFMIDDKKYKFKRDTNMSEWVNSKYNEDGFYLNDVSTEAHIYRNSEEGIRAIKSIDASTVIRRGDHFETYLKQKR